VRYTLHTARQADWEKDSKKPKNIWQKVASRSHGLLTPANIASVIGGVLAIYGLWIIMDGDTVRGLVFLTIGRIADIADGVIAEYTRTKSPLGEMIDASIDKLVVAAALIVLGALELVPWVIIVIIALQNVANVLISIIAKLRQKTLHPSRLGKVSAAFSWATIILYPLGDWLQKDTSAAGGGTFIKAVAWSSFAVYVVLGLQASMGYADVIYQKARKSYRLFR
jgi:phosphatidylglycerophosphate synthase